MVAQQDQPAPPATNDPAPAPATDAPAAEPVPPTDPEPGQETLPAENQPAAEPEPPAPETNEPEEPDSPSAEPKGEVSPNVQKRIDALTRQKSELAGKVAELESKLAEVESSTAATAGQRPDATLPPTVAKLKTVQECEQRLQTAQASMETIQDFLDANPGDAGTEYQMGEKIVTRQELIDSRKAWREEIRSIPQHAQALTQQAQFTRQQQAARQQVLTEFPYLADPEHATTKAVQAKLKEASFLNSFAAPEYAALVWVKGEQAVKAEVEARKGKTPAPLHRPAGTVPARKPMTASGSAARPDAAAVSLQQAVSANGKSGSKGSFADVIAAAGR